MGKVKLNLVSGSSVEKPLVNAFIENNNTYVVLDNEINGSMGLPIILVSKLENDKLVKIVDQNEWQLVKKKKKNIIAGNKVEFVKLNNELNADDIYYTQLTLPVPSFDALKKSYTFNESEPTINVIADNINNEVVASAPAEEVPAVNNEPANQEIQVNNDEPIVATEPIINFDNNISINNEQVSPVEPAVNNTPVMPEVPTDTTEINQEIPTIAVDTNANNADIQNEPMVDLNNPLFNNISTILGTRNYSFSNNRNKL